MSDTAQQVDVPAAAYRTPSASVGRSAMTVGRYYTTNALAVFVPLCAGLVFFGWRAAVAVGVVVGSALVANYIWQRIGMRGSQLRASHALWQALLLAMMLPAGLAHFGHSSHVWPILPLAGLLLAILNWTLGGVGAGRVHPVVATFLLLTFLYGPLMMPRRVLQRSHALQGGLLHSVDVSHGSAGLPLSGTDFIEGDWLTRPQRPHADATFKPPAAEVLGSYTSGRMSPERTWVSLEGLFRDRLEPLEDLALGAQPGGIGTASAIAVVIGGLFLLYRGMIDYRVPLLVVISSMIGFMVLPIPTRIGSAVLFRWSVSHVYGIGWSLGLTVANYELLAGPLLFTAFFLATAPSVCPLTRRGRAMFAVLLGFFAAAAQLYLSVEFGSYLALLFASLLTPTLDKWLQTYRGR